MNASEKLLLISQSQEDADYLLDEKRSCKYIIRTFVLWTIELSIYSALSYIIHQINVFYGWYNYPYYYHFYNIGRIIFNLLMLATLWNAINRSKTLQERRFLKMWIVFPACISIDQIFNNLFYFVNADFLISYYLSFSLSIIINIIMLLYIHSYFRNRSILIIVVINIIYCILSFLYSVYFPTLNDLTALHLVLFSAIEFIKRYSILNIISTIFVLLCIGGDNDEQHNKFVKNV